MTSAARRRLALLAVPFLVLGTLIGLAWIHPQPAAAAASTPITVDGGKPGRVFDGVGAISGGGGNSRLLVDYPEPQRSELLDYLFKPGYGASLQMLKIEIGGDTNSTDGAEASHEHAKGSVDCGQGYEWWLAEQAKARNPGIKLAGLSWGAPGWIGGGRFWSQDMIDYLMDWFGCAQQHHLAIDYLGGWNERYGTADVGTKAAWFKNLKSALANHGHAATKVVAGDDNWSVADDMAKNPTLRDAVDVVGVHYPCGYNSDFKQCDSTAAARELGKPLWASENGSEDYQVGAAPVARALNRDYIDGKMTSYTNWPVIAALYPNLFFSSDGMSVANQPWSGHYDIGKTTWVTAHTTQFTQPGWRYIDAASGYLGGKRDNGSYVTLKSATNSGYSSVIETMDAKESQIAEFTVAGGLPTGAVHVWATNVASDNAADWFKRQPDITPSNGHYTVNLRPGYVYTVTTTTPAGVKGTVTPPPVAPLALPYTDDFDAPAASTSPKYFTDMNGAFQTRGCGGGRAGTCVRQMAPTSPIRWTDEHYNAPYTILGDAAWRDYTVTADTMLEQPGSVELLGRVMRQNKNNNGLDAYHLRVSDTGEWSIVKSDLSWNFTTLASGKAAALGTNTWHTMALAMRGTTLTARIDGKAVGSATDSAYPNGQAGLGVTGYQTDQFDKLAITPDRDAMAHVGPVTSGPQGKCATAGRRGYVNTTDNGNKAQTHDCAGTPDQAWAWTGSALTHDGLCLDVTNEGTSNGSPVELWECNGKPHQQWSPQPGGRLTSAKSGRCLTAPGPNDAQLVIQDCAGGANQKWALP